MKPLSLQRSIAASQKRKPPSPLPRALPPLQLRLLRRLRLRRIAASEMLSKLPSLRTALQLMNLRLQRQLRSGQLVPSELLLDEPPTKPPEPPKQQRWQLRQRGLKKLALQRCSGSLRPCLIMSASQPSPPPVMRRVWLPQQLPLPLQLSCHERMQISSLKPLQHMPQLPAVAVG